MWFAISGAFDFLQAYNAAITALATVAIGVFTYFLVRVTNRQARLTRKAIELGTKEFVATHRPKIRIRYIEGPPVTNAIPTPTASIVAAEGAATGHQAAVEARPQGAAPGGTGDRARREARGPGARLVTVAPRHTRWRQGSAALILVLSFCVVVMLASTWEAALGGS